MKHKKRSIIITVDHRAREMNKSYNLNYTERKEIDKLSQTYKSMDGAVYLTYMMFY